MEQSLSVKFGGYSTEYLLTQLHRKSALYRAHALDELARRSVNNVELQSLVLEEIDKPENKSMKVFGVISVSYIGIGKVIQYGNEETKNKLLNIVELWDCQEKKDLIWFLRSESLIDDSFEFKM